MADKHAFMMVPHTYTHLSIGEGETVVQCNDCGAYLIDRPEHEVKHYDTCAPTDPKWFN